MRSGRGPRGAPGWRGGGLFVVLMLAPGAAAAQAVDTRPFSVTPEVSLETLFTDNAELASSGARSDFVARASLALTARLASTRTLGHFSGQVAYDAYARSSNLSGWTIAGDGDLVVQLVRDTLSFDADGAIVNGAVSTLDAPAADRAGAPGRVRLTSYSGGPRLTLSWAEIADIEASARFGQVLYSAHDRATSGVLPQDDSFFRGELRIDTAQRSHRLQLVTSAEVIDDDTGYHSANGVESAFVRLAPGLRLLGRVGYDHIRQHDVTTIDAPLLSVGLEATPAPNSRLLIEFGSRYDRPSWAANADIALSPNLVLAARYFEVVEPDQLFQARSLQEPTTQGGSPTPSPPPVPTALTIPGVVGGPSLQSNLYNRASRARTADLRVSYSGPINDVMASAAWTERKFLGSDERDRSLVIDFAYGRRLRPDLTLTFEADYARTFDSPTFGSGERYELAGRLDYRLNSSSRLDLRISRADSRQGSGRGASFTEDAIAVAIRKTF